MSLNIFNKETFTLKEFCKTISNIKSIQNCNNYDIEISNINIILDCYLKFSSGYICYNKKINHIRNNKGLLFIKNNKNIYFREILQNFDMEFTKLIIRIKTEPKNYDIIISWKEFEEKMGISKKDIENLFL